MQSGAPERGLFTSTRALAGSLVALAGTRLELAATEVEEERLLLTEMALWAMLTLFLLALGTVFAGLLLVLLLWDGPREWALGALTAVFLAGALLAGRTWRQRVRTKPPLLAATLAELRRDRAALEGLHEARP